MRHQEVCKCASSGKAFPAMQLTYQTLSFLHFKCKSLPKIIKLKYKFQIVMSLRVSVEFQLVLRGVLRKYA